MTDLPEKWDYDPAPSAARNALIREALIAYGREKPELLLHLVKNVRDRDDVADLVMGFAEIYRRDTDGSMGRDLALARLAQDLEIDREEARRAS